MARPDRGVRVMPEPNETAVPTESPEHGPDAGVLGTAGPTHDDVERGRRARGRWILGGFVAGIVFAYVLAAVRVAMEGWHVLPYKLIFDLIWSPILGAEMGLGIGYRRHPDPRKGRRFWGRPRFRMVTLMILIAYIALLFGTGVSMAPIGEAARLRAEVSIVRSEHCAVPKAGRGHRGRGPAEAGRRRGAARGGSRMGWLRRKRRSCDPWTRRPRPSSARSGMNGSRPSRSTAGRAWSMPSRSSGASSRITRRSPPSTTARRRPWLPVAPDPTRPPTY